eukprot:CAMPEP_0170473550 /NCGR_PEP_ID=MMETSP0123-20130129/15456_1 /TAXON_ID=182087 /ORGANISM="Favella ehrenbergii, Strain Fehren 1" /LENGTH=59 /DNA_ID=CAMNT_0010742683 /DNA_START=63 /DNA_END=239 /DNA_ORIENTATION=-
MALLAAVFLFEKLFNLVQVLRASLDLADLVAQVTAFEAEFARLLLHMPARRYCGPVRPI